MSNCTAKQGLTGGAQTKPGISRTKSIHTGRMKGVPPEYRDCQIPAVGGQPPLLRARKQL